jgi:hypothetical protein
MRVIFDKPIAEKIYDQIVDARLNHQVIAKFLLTTEEYDSLVDYLKTFKLYKGYVISFESDGPTRFMKFHDVLIEEDK